MRHFTSSGGNWYLTKETSNILAKLMQVIIVKEGDDDSEDPDSYWHP